VLRPCLRYEPRPETLGVGRKLRQLPFHLGLYLARIGRGVEQGADVPGVLRTASVELEQHEVRRAHDLDCCQAWRPTTTSTISLPWLTRTLPASGSSGSPSRIRTSRPGASRPAQTSLRRILVSTLRRSVSAVERLTPRTASAAAPISAVCAFSRSRTRRTSESRLIRRARASRASIACRPGPLVRARVARRLDRGRGQPHRQRCLSDPAGAPPRGALQGSCEATAYGIAHEALLPRGPWLQV
jgi:hypothetical protein